MHEKTLKLRDEQTLSDVSPSCNLATATSGQCGDPSRLVETTRSAGVNKENTNTDFDLPVLSVTN